MCGAPYPRTNPDSLTSAALLAWHSLPKSGNQASPKRLGHVGCSCLIPRSVYILTCSMRIPPAMLEYLSQRYECCAHLWRKNMVSSDQPVATLTAAVRRMSTTGVRRGVNTYKKARCTVPDNNFLQSSPIITSRAGKFCCGFHRECSLNAQYIDRVSPWY